MKTKGPKPDIEPLLTAADVAGILKCSQDFVIGLVRAGKMPALGLGLVAAPASRPGRRMLRFRPTDVREYIAAEVTLSLPATPAEAPPPAALPGPSLLRSGRKAFRDR
jgi:hypothetical protein